jgi:hypothetical protein
MRIQVETVYGECSPYLSNSQNTPEAFFSKKEKKKRAAYPEYFRSKNVGNDNSTHGVGGHMSPNSGGEGGVYLDHRNNNKIIIQRKRTNDLIL